MSARPLGRVSVAFQLCEVSLSAIKISNTNAIKQERPLWRHNFLEIMHHINRRSLDKALPQIAQMLSQAADEHSSILEKIETYLRYAVDCNEHIDETTIERSLDASNTKEELMPTLAQKWFSEAEARGEARGKAEGIIGGQSKLLRKLIHMRFGQIPPEVENKIASATEVDLERFAENVLEANSAIEVVEMQQE